MSSDSMEDNADFDVEAQESLLETSAEGKSEAQTTSNSATQNLMRSTFLLLRSCERFKLGANYAAADITSSSSTSASYASVTSSDDILITQDSEIVDHEGILDARRAPETYERNIELQRIQRKNITEIVKKKNGEALSDFGGVRVVAEALNNDLENGISSPRQVLRRKPSQLRQYLGTFLSSFLGACNSYTIFLLSIAAVLSLGFGIKEDGLHMGWFNGGVLIFAILIIVMSTTVHNCWKELSHKKLESSRQSKGGKLKVRVIRGGESHFVSEIDLRVGDIAVLEKGDQVPADGIFINSDQALELDDGTSIKSTTIDEKNPFLFYGTRVVNGDARMLVTSTLMDTVWGEMMSQAMETSAKNKCTFESYLNKLSNFVHIAGLLISILISVALILRYEAGMLDDERRSRPDTKGEPTPQEMILLYLKALAKNVGCLLIAQLIRCFQLQNLGPGLLNKERKMSKKFAF